MKPFYHSISPYRIYPLSERLKLIGEAMRKHLVESKLELLK
jgi:hypothetical protein